MIVSATTTPFLVCVHGQGQNAVDILFGGIIFTELLFELVILSIQLVLFSGRSFVIGFELCQIGEFAENAGCFQRLCRNIKHPQSVHTFPFYDLDFFDIRQSYGFYFIITTCHRYFGNGQSFRGF